MLNTDGVSRMLHYTSPYSIRRELLEGTVNTGTVRVPVQMASLPRNCLLVLVRGVGGSDRL